MKRGLIFIMLLCLTVSGGCVKKESLQNITSRNDEQKNYLVTMKRDLLCLMMAYPEYITSVERDRDNRVYMVMKSGKKILYDDKRVKNAKDKLVNPDLQDMMEPLYPLGKVEHLMDKDFDPGRIRVYSLLKEVYGESKSQVQSNLVNVKIGYQNLQFNGNNKAAERFQRIGNELTSLVERQKNIYSFIFPTSGTFNYRYIAGTNQLSPHSFGIAIDLASDKRDYWKWTSREEGEKRLRTYPKDMVQIFENNYFVWGGKWGHFDILHFEYRPELILKAKYFSNKSDLSKPWYEGVPIEDTMIKHNIQFIDKVFK